MMAHLFIAKIFLAKIFFVKIIVIISAILGIYLQHFTSAKILPILRVTYTAFDLAIMKDDGILVPILDDMIKEGNLGSKHSLVQINTIPPIYEGNDYIKKVTQKISILSQIQINKMFESLVEKGILTTEDLANLHNKIDIRYLLGCDKTKWSYTIQQSTDEINHITNNTLENITLNVNVCFNLAYIQNLPTYIKQISAHELGHYIYYFKDKAPQIFEKICRRDNKTICSNNKFMSNYAKSWPEEDYAESFAHWYLNDLSNSNFTTKLNYFFKLSPQSNLE